MITIRPIEVTDAVRLLALRTKLDAETPFMVFEPGERPQGVQQQHATLQAL